MHVGLGSRVVPKSDDNDAMESNIGLPMFVEVEPMPVGLAGGSGYGTDSAQGCEGGLRAKAIRVAPGSNEGSRRCIGSYAKAIHQGWRYLSGESPQLLLQVLYLLTQLTMAAGKGAKSILGRRYGSVHPTGPKVLAPGDKGGSSEATQDLTKLGRGRNDQGLHLVEGLGACLDGRVLGAL